MLPPREYSQRLGVLSHAQLQAALDRFDLGELIDAEAVSGGLFGQNVFITSTRGNWVLRGAPHYDGQFQKERFFSRLIHEETEADAPWPFHIERSDEVFGWHYALMPRLPGDNPGDPGLQQSLSNDERVSLAGALGAYLKRLQSKTWDGCFVYDHESDALRPFDTPYETWFEQQIRDWLHRCRSRQWDLSAPVDPSTLVATTEADVEWVESIIKQTRGALTEPFAAVLVHTDYKDGNTVAQRTPGGWRINGVFDVGEMYIGNGEYDLARTACGYLNSRSGRLEAFVGAYFDGQAPDPGFKDRMRAYILCDRLIIWEYGQRNKIWFREGVTLREWAEPFVEMEIAMAAPAMTATDTIGRDSP
jgi:aminoglycoside phosphotransferase (APT) family kinase protein